MKAYAGIGSRATPNNIQKLMAKIAATLAKKNWTLYSGGAWGADTAFESGCKNNNGKCNIFLPRKGFNNNDSSLILTTEQLAKSRRILIDKDIIPYFDNLLFRDQRFHARNVLQVLGKDYKTPVKMVICWTPNAAIDLSTAKHKETGGTRSAIQLALLANIPVFNLANKEHLDRILNWINAEK